MDAEINESNVCAIVTILREKIKMLENLKLEVNLSAIVDVLKDLKKDKKTLIDCRTW